MQVQAGFDLAAGPLLRAVLFDRAAGRHPVLLLAVHHLVVDGVSWRILLEDLNTAYSQAAAGTAARPRPEDHVVPRLGRAAGRPRPRPAASTASCAYWTATRPRRQRPRLPLDGDGPTPPPRARSVTVAPRARSETRALLHDVPGAYRTQINDVLLAALGRVLSRWTGQRPGADRSGGPRPREDLLAGTDLSRTVGWFTTIYPVALHHAARRRLGRQALKSVKEQLRAIPHRGLGYGALRYLSGADGPGLASQPPVSFNYLGQLDRAFPARRPDPRHRATAWTPAPAPPPPARHQLDVTGRIQDQRLQLTWTYSASLHHRATIAALAEELDRRAAGDHRPLRPARRGRPHPLRLPPRPPGPGHHRPAGRRRPDGRRHLPPDPHAGRHGLPQPVQARPGPLPRASRLRPGRRRATRPSWPPPGSTSPTAPPSSAPPSAWENVPQPVQVVHRRAACPSPASTGPASPRPSRRDALTGCSPATAPAGLDLTARPRSCG